MNFIEFFEKSSNLQKMRKAISTMSEQIVELIDENALTNDLTSNTLSPTYIFNDINTLPDLWRYDLIFNEIQTQTSFG